MKLRKSALSLFAASIVLCSTSVHAGNAVVASGEASEEVFDASVQLVSAGGHLSGAGLNLSGAAGITVGHALSETALSAVSITGQTVAFSSGVLAAGLLTTAQLSSNLTQAGVLLSTDAVVLAACAAGAGINMSVETAQLFLDQAVNIAAASGRLSGEVGDLALLLTHKGVVLSADSAILIANAAAQGVEVSQEQARKIIAASLAIASDCIQKAVIAERYIVMTLEEANTLLREASVATIRAATKGGKTAYTFSKDVAIHLHGLGIDAAKLATELAEKAALATADATVKAIQGADDAIVVVINSGAGLVVVTLDALTESVEKATQKLQ